MAKIHTNQNNWDDNSCTHLMHISITQTIWMWEIIFKLTLILRIFHIFLDLKNHKQLIINTMTVMRLIKNRKPTTIIIGHDDNISSKLHFIVWELGVGFTNIVIPLIDNNNDNNDSFISLTDDTTSLSYIIKKWGNFKVWNITVWQHTCFNSSDSNDANWWCKCWWNWLWCQFVDLYNERN